MKMFGIVGWSGSGKTVLVEALLPLLIARGLRVSTLKHTHHRVDLDSPGKDSFRHRQAGATEVVLVSPSRWTLIHEARGEEEPKLDDLIGRMTPVDLLLIEGFKGLKHPKLEVFRPTVGQPLLAADDASIVAVATDTPDGVALTGFNGPVHDLNDVAAIAVFIAAFCGFETVAGPI